MNIQNILFYHTLLLVAIYIMYHLKARTIAAQNRTHEDYWLVSSSDPIESIWRHVLEFPRTFRAFNDTSWTTWQKTRMALGLRVWLPKNWKDRT